MYTYRRDLEATELVPAIGVGVAVGLAAFYVASLFLQRTPLVSGDLAVKEPPSAGDGRVPRDLRPRGAERRQRPAPRG